MKLYPIEECQEKAEQYIAKGAKAYQQFLCTHCGAKQTMETPNMWYATGKCEECNQITDIMHDGCNWLLHMPLEK